VEYADIIIAVAGTLALAWIADQLTGRRGLIATGLAAAVGATCGWFLAVRVFAVSTMDDFLWVLWALVAAVVCLVAFFLFRSKR
jgi:uncharacterized membrane protein YeaQ/YmgE (transglycosylase-associated protein family)